MGHVPTAQRWPVWIWLVVGASVVLLVAELIAAGVSTYVLVRPYPQSAAFNCMPPGFPTYPHAAITAADFSSGNPAPGDTVSCRMTYHSGDTFAKVVDFYRHSMNTGQWQTGNLGLVNFSSMDLAFTQRYKPDTHGFVTVQFVGRGTDIEVQLFS